MEWMRHASDLGYLVAAALFVFGLKNLGSPRTAVRGNQLGAMGMLVAVLVTLLRMGVGEGFIGAPLIVGGLAVGAAIGALMARRVQMTSMPEMVALLNGFGGAASALVALSGLVSFDLAHWTTLDPAGHGAVPIEPAWSVFLVAAGASSIVGWATFTGSVVAMMKLYGTFRRNLAFPGINVVKVALLVVGVAFGYEIWASGPGTVSVVGIVVSASVLGILFVAPIGGADMPVVISFLNSLSGVAAATTGFVVDNTALIISGSLVGAAGLILTAIMCKAMNRPFIDVMFKAYGAPSGGAAPGEKRTVRGYEAEEAALVFDGARSVIIVPGYGMAVSQSQHVVREFAEALERLGADVKFAIHPVAGRMPGHMNVLLAEANLPYEQLVELDDINPYFSECDVCLVVGANDTINPAARTDPTGPLGGMPILDVEKARTVIIVKRSLSPGYAGVDNDLFYRPSTMMLFGDGKAKLTELLAALKEL